MFGAGSIGKLITWTAAMQLAERGLVDLDADVNAYLRTFATPDTFDEPVTLRRLLTHTPGFDDTAIASLTGLESCLATHMPRRLRPPGMARSSFRQPLAPSASSRVAGSACARSHHYTNSQHPKPSCCFRYSRMPRTEIAKKCIAPFDSTLGANRSIGISLAQETKDVLDR